MQNVSVIPVHHYRERSGAVAHLTLPNGKVHPIKIEVGSLGNAHVTVFNLPDSAPQPFIAGPSQRRNGEPAWSWRTTFAHRDEFNDLGAAVINYIEYVRTHNVYGQAVPPKWVIGE